MITIRYKPLSSKKYSIYLDFYQEQATGKKRKYEFLRLYVSRNYNKSKRILAIDKDKVDLAMRIRSKRELEIYGIQTEYGNSKTSNNLSLLDYIEKVKNDSNNGSKYQPFVNKLQDFTGNKQIVFSQVSVKFIEELFGYIQDETSRNTAVNYIGILKTVMNKAFKEALISYNPFAKWKIPVKTEIHRMYLELHELKRLNECEYKWNIDVKPAFLFSCFTGLRFSDIKKLKYADIKILQPEDSPVQKSTEYLQNIDIVLELMPHKTKSTSGKRLSMPLSSQAMKILDLDRLMDNTKNKNKLIFEFLPNNDSVNLIMKKWAKQASIEKNLHFHAGRHTFATLCLTSGIDIYTVSKLLGHSSIENTQIYAKIIDRKLKQEVHKFHRFL
jgi:site-specific recombinase XerD